jgi:hypothetical protein
LTQDVFVWSLESKPSPLLLCHTNAQHMVNVTVAGLTNGADCSDTFGPRGKNVLKKLARPGRLQLVPDQLNLRCQGSSGRGRRCARTRPIPSRQRDQTEEPRVFNPGIHLHRDTAIKHARQARPVLRAKAVLELHGVLSPSCSRPQQLR